MINFQANESVKAMEKKQKAVEKVIAEVIQKNDDLNSELAASQREARTFMTEIFQLKAAVTERQEEVEAEQRTNAETTGGK